MKKLLSYLTLLLLTLSTSTFAKVDELKSRLGKVNAIQAEFKQSVYDAHGKLIQSGKGDMWLRRPNLFRWHMTQPDESLLISDGKTMWFYNPFVEQVSAVWLKNASYNTPLMLITRNSPEDWSQYNVRQEGDDFILTPKLKSGPLQPFEVNVTKSGRINSFVAKENDGQRSVYQLSNNSSRVAMDRFRFVMPQGVSLDDQRK